MPDPYCGRRMNTIDNTTTRRANSQDKITQAPRRLRLVRKFSQVSRLTQTRASLAPARSRTVSPTLTLKAYAVQRYKDTKVLAVTVTRRTRQLCVREAPPRCARVQPAPRRPATPRLSSASAGSDVVPRRTARRDLPHCECVPLLSCSLRSLPHRSGRQDKIEGVPVAK